MKRLLIIIICICFMLSCKVFYGDNYDGRVKMLELGMNRRQALHIMGNDYVVENISRTPDGNIEALKFTTRLYSDYVLVFFNDELVEINNVPRIPVHNNSNQQNVTIKQENSD